MYLLFIFLACYLYFNKFGVNGQWVRGNNDSIFFFLDEILNMKVSNTFNLKGFGCEIPGIFNHMHTYIYMFLTCVCEAVWWESSFVLYTD